MERKMIAEEFIVKTKGATCQICGKELFDKKNIEEHYKNDHPYLTSG